VERVTVREKELTDFRYTYYGLFVGLWGAEPSKDSISPLRENIAERIKAAAEVHPLMGEGWRVIREFLAERSPEDAADEYTRLFLGPFSSIIQPYESYYLTGRFFGAPLIALRRFLESVGVEKKESEFTDPEDMLAFELEVMRWLVGKQRAAAGSKETTRWLQLQAAFLKEHLLVWAPSCAQDMERAAGSYFYRGAATVLRGFLEVEHALFRDLGLDKVASIEEMRQRYGVGSTWKGPTFEPADDSPGTPVPRKDD
jgi:TorA maturation chaperone TorD